VFGLVVLFAAAGNAQTWIQLQPGNPLPPPVYGSAGAYNPTTGRFIDFGGSANPPSGLLPDGIFWNAVWVLANANGNGTPAWIQAVVENAPGSPGRRYGPSSAYDPATNRMIIYAGQPEYLSTFFTDVWLLRDADGSATAPSWVQINPTGYAPPPRRDHRAVYDPASNRMIVFGGQGQGPSLQFLNDVWILTNANGTGDTPPSWIQLSPSGAAPLPRSQFVIGYDSAGNRLIVYGGLNSSGALSDTWVLANANGLADTPVWQQLSLGPGPNQSAGAGSGQASSVGGYDPASNQLATLSYDNSAVWILKNANGLGGAPTWQQLVPAGNPPTPRFGMAGAYDAIRGNLLVFGGQVSGGYALNDTFSLTNATGTRQAAPVVNQRLRSSVRFRHPEIPAGARTHPAGDQPAEPRDGRDFHSCVERHAGSALAGIAGLRNPQ